MAIQEIRQSKHFFATGNEQPFSHLRDVGSINNEAIAEYDTAVLK